MVRGLDAGPYLDVPGALNRVEDALDLYSAEHMHQSNQLPVNLDLALEV